MTALCPVIVVRSSVQNPATIPCDQRLFQGLSTASSVRAPSGRNASTADAPKRLGYAQPFLVRCLMAGMAGRRSGRNGCFGAAAAGVLHGARTIPTVAGRSMRALSRLADVAGFWTLDRTTITGRSAVILRQHATPFRPMIVPFDDLELVYQSLRTLEPLHTHKFPRVNAQDNSPDDVGADFLRLGFRFPEDRGFFGGCSASDSVGGPMKSASGRLVSARKSYTLPSHCCSTRKFGGSSSCRCSLAQCQPLSSTLSTMDWPRFPSLLSCSARRARCALRLRRPPVSLSLISSTPWCGGTARRRESFQWRAAGPSPPGRW